MNYKIVLLGASFVGKSTIIKQLMYNQFYEKTESTIGCSFFKKKLMVNDKEVWLHIIDTAGSQRFNTLLPMYVKGAHAILFVYDVTNLESFDKIKLLLNDKTIQQSNATMFLIGNKLDLPRVIDFNEVKSFAKEHLMHHHELTATSYHDVKQLFMTVASLLSYPQSIENNVVLTNNKKTNCCYS